MSSSAAPATAGFRSLPLSAPLLRALDAAGFTAPRPIQKAALPHALAGRDVLGLAQTGTGKTAAFALPILERVLAKGPRPKVLPRGLPAPIALVVAPTRELAAQIHDEFARLGKYTTTRFAVIFGGVGQAGQVRALADQPEVVVACPGRLIDLLDQKLLSLASVETLVLDEADHMFDMGFLPSIRRIVAKLPKKRQNLLFSATMPPELRKLANEVLVRPEVVELAHSRPPETIDHAIHPVAEGDKTARLEALFAEADFRSAIVFTRTKHRAKRLALQLEKRGHRAVALQGNLSQSRRERAMGGFRDGTYDILVATDIVARGIDVAAVSHVVNFDVPMTPEAYTHRIGRTGRGEAVGRAITFATPADSDLVRAIERHLGAPVPREGAKGGERRAAAPAASQTARPSVTSERPPRRERSASTDRPARRERSSDSERPARRERDASSERPARRDRARGASPERERGSTTTTRPSTAPRVASVSTPDTSPFGAGL